MLGMTLAASFAAHIGETMITGIGGNSRIQRLVTTQAFLAGDILAQFMTRGAIADPFELLMIARELSGRNLRPARNEAG